MKHSRTLIPLSCALLTLTCVGVPLCAEIITFTSRDAWSSYVQQANFGADFNGITTDVSFAETAHVFNAINIANPLSQQSFPMFQASVVGGPSPTGTNQVGPSPYSDTPSAVLYGDNQTTPIWGFLQPVNAFGADFQTVNGQALMVLNPIAGEQTTLTIPTGSGFFGWADTGPNLYNAMNFALAPSNFNSYTLAFDNVAGRAVFVPEQSTLTLVITGGLLLPCTGCWWLRSPGPLTSRTHRRRVKFHAGTFLSLIHFSGSAHCADGPRRP